MKRTALILIVILLPVSEALSQLRQARRALDDGDFERALTFVNERLSERPEDHNAYMLLAQIHRAQAAAADVESYAEHLGAMAEAYRKVIELNPRNTQAGPGLVTSYMDAFSTGVEAWNNAAQTSDPDSSATYFMEAAKRFMGAAAVMPDSLDPYLNWAIAALQTDNSELAILPFQRAIEIAPDDPSVTEWYDRLARIYLTTDREEEAVVLLEGALEMYPNSDEIEGLLLGAYGMADQNERAIERYRVRAEAMPDDQRTQYNLGSLLLQAEAYDEAIIYLQRAVELDAENANAQYNLGAAFINKATNVQQEAVALNEDLRERRSEISDDEAEERQAAIYALDDQRQDLMRQAIPHLEIAKEVTELSGGGDLTSICIALYQAYAQTNQMEAVETVKACAGF